MVGKMLTLAGMPTEEWMVRKEYQVSTSSYSARIHLDLFSTMQKVNVCKIRWNYCIELDLYKNAYPEINHGSLKNTLGVCSVKSSRKI